MENQMVKGKTKKGTRTKEKIVQTACEIMVNKGVNTTNLDEILAESHTGKGQFYHYFRSKDHLVHEVLGNMTNEFFSEFDQVFTNLDSWDGFKSFFDSVLERNTKNLFRGCPFGNFSNEVSNHNNELRTEISSAFARMEKFVEDGLVAMRKKDLIIKTADPKSLSKFIWAAIEGGILMTKTEKDVGPLKNTLDHTLTYLKTYSTPQGIAN